MANNHVIFIRVSSDGEVHQGRVPPEGQTGNLVTRLQPGEEIVFHATAEQGVATLFSAAAAWPGRVCGPYRTGILGALGEDELKRAGLWFRPPVAGTEIPKTVKYTFNSNGVLRAESGNTVETINLMDLVRRDAAGNIIEHASHYVALRPTGAAKVSLKFEQALAPQSLTLTASYS